MPKAKQITCDVVCTKCGRHELISTVISPDTPQNKIKSEGVKALRARAEKDGWRFLINVDNPLKDDIVCPDCIAVPKRSQNIHN